MLWWSFRAWLDLEVGDDVVELREGGESEEDVHDVGRQFDARFPFLSENPGGDEVEETKM